MSRIKMNYVMLTDALMFAVLAWAVWYYASAPAVQRTPVNLSPPPRPVVRESAPPQLINIETTSGAVTPPSTSAGESGPASVAPDPRFVVSPVPYTVPRGATFGSDMSKASVGELMCIQICTKLFPGISYYYNYRDKNLRNPDTSQNLEFDIFYPSLAFAVEFNGAQHYGDSSLAGSDPDRQAARDTIKAAAALHHGIVLVMIPHTYKKLEAEETIRRAAAAAGILRQ